MENVGVSLFVCLDRWRSHNNNNNKKNLKEAIEEKDGCFWPKSDLVVVESHVRD